MKPNCSGADEIFIGREKDLAHLEHLYSQSQNGLIVCAMTGHRRIGKTTLLNRFRESKENLYFFVSPKTEAELTKALLDITKRKMSIPDYIDFKNLPSLIEFIFDNFEGVIVFDEFQNFSKVKSSIFSDFQYLIDSKKESKILLILCGSYLGMMKKVFHDDKEPLFGRLRTEIRLKPLGIRDVFKFLNVLGFEDLEEMMIIYSIFGGTPFYYAIMEKLNIKGDINNILEEMFFNPYALLKDEVSNILTLEFGGKKHLYYSILEAISLGHNRNCEIAQYLGYRPTSLSPYINDLLNYYEYIERKIPVTFKVRSKTKNTRYAIEDPLMSFWFRFIYNHLSEMESGMYDYVIKKTMEELSVYIGRRMEGIIKELLYIVNGANLDKKSRFAAWQCSRNQGPVGNRMFPKAQKRPKGVFGTKWEPKGQIPLNLNYKEVLPFNINKIGNWWKRSGEEVDLIALDDRNKNILLCEVKWRNKKADFNAVFDLIQKADLIKGYKDYKKWFLVVSKSGFTKTALSEMERKSIFHWELQDIAEML